jgi:hypothetical protein
VHRRHPAPAAAGPGTASDTTATLGWLDAGSLRERPERRVPLGVHGPAGHDPALLARRAGAAARPAREHRTGPGGGGGRRWPGLAVDLRTLEVAWLGDGLVAVWGQDETEPVVRRSTVEQWPRPPELLVGGCCVEPAGR